MINKTELLKPGNIYHVYNRANGSEKLFISDENYRFFMEKYIHHISPVADTFCYCLMPKHFHFLVRIKSEEDLKVNATFPETSQTFPKFGTLEKFEPQTEKLLSKCFSNLFSSYTQAFNKQQNRKGSLFMKNFKRKHVNDMGYLRQLVIYIHQNPVAAEISKSPEDWPHSSYRNIISDETAPPEKDELIGWFEDKENFLSSHSKKVGQPDI